MTRRAALFVLAAMAAIVKGRTVEAEDNYDPKLVFILPKPFLALVLDDIRYIEVRKGGETRRIECAEIWDALK